MLARTTRWSAMAGLGLLILSLGCTGSEGMAFKPKRDPLPAQQPEIAPEEVAEAVPADILPRTHLAAGRLHESQGRLVRAVEQYRLAVALNPNAVEALNRLGIVLDRLGRFKQADAAFNRAIKAAPKDAYIYNNLAFSYIMQLRYAEAEETLRQALSLQPDFPRARINLAMCLAQQERFDEALAQFHTVLSAEDAYYNMGLMYQSKRKPVEAARSFQAALELNPRMVAARKRLDKMPEDVLQEAIRNTQATASPRPIEETTSQQLAVSQTPTSRPAQSRSEREKPTVEEPEGANAEPDDAHGDIGSQPGPQTSVPAASSKSAAPEPTRIVAVEPSAEILTIAEAAVQAEPQSATHHTANSPVEPRLADAEATNAPRPEATVANTPKEKAQIMPTGPTLIDLAYDLSQRVGRCPSPELVEAATVDPFLDEWQYARQADVD